VAGGNENEVQLRALEREARAQRDQLESYLTRYREALARDADNAVPADARIISRAIVPQLPSFPKKLPIMALTTLAVMVLASAALAVRELLAALPAQASVWTPVALAQGPDVAPSELDDGRVSPVMPFVAREADASNAVAASLEARGEAENPETRYAFDDLIARLAQARPGDRGGRVLVTGLGGSEAARMAR